MADDYDDFDENVFEDDELYDDEMIDGDYDEYDDEYEYDDEDMDEEEGGIDFLGMVQDEEGNWVYPEDLD